MRADAEMMPDQEDIAEQQELLAAHRATLAHYLKQLSLLGTAYAPPVVSHGIRETRANISRIKGILRGWGVQVDDHPNDEEPPPGAPGIASPPVLQGVQVPPGERLYRVLSGLNYHQQDRTFRHCRRQVASFLICGLPGYGQRWLLNRLLRRYVEVDKVVRVDLRRVALGRDIGALWRELGRQVDRETRPSDPEEIAGRVRAWLQTLNVVLIFYNIDCMPESYLRELVDAFWRPLVRQTRDEAPCAKNLMMFLVDHTGMARNWNGTCAGQIGAGWEPDVTIRLPEIGLFSQEDLNGWIDYAYEDLPQQMRERADDMAETILENSDDGIPELVLEEICRLWNHDWDQGEREWLRF